MPDRSENDRPNDHTTRRADTPAAGHREHCHARAWCDEIGPEHDGAHHGEAPGLRITATAARADFASHDDDEGVVVPEVIAQLFEEVEATADLDRLHVTIIVSRPDGRAAHANLTLTEAERLAGALMGLLVEVDQDRAAGLR